MTGNPQIQLKPSLSLSSYPSQPFSSLSNRRRRPSSSCRRSAQHLSQPFPLSQQSSLPPAPAPGPLPQLRSPLSQPVAALSSLQSSLLQQATIYNKLLVMETRDSVFFPNVGFLDVAILLIIGFSSLILFRIFYVIYRSSKPLYSIPPGPLSTLIILGSGGHTAEMLNLLAVMQMNRFKPRYYIAAATDNMSLQKARVLEDSLMEKAEVELVGTSQFMQIYRSREVGQSYITSVGTTSLALAHALWLMIKIRPQVILCNGPGTCIPLCVIAFFFKVIGVRWSSIFYVESIARVRRLSLSGLLLYKLRMADQLFVQWPQLKSKYPQANYVGRLM